ncbi:hypothetical protein UA08_08235 [Talaromyces atroroseus]|uniref:Alpha N-terminal protein methyltransferase 1 n=1 Tax=Talaromyces atroroseus TaxID=1441469 RepID=A0A225ALT4_TALAT|nr:hypothetical protein UA08_08235 [Talaromyces atroroseus]OKL56519.1 hypothetical protein UA08_08235 [Talaromyces atroroseus]
MTPPTKTPDSLINHASAIQYWNSMPATVNGMLGGFPQISRIDLRGSANFLAKIRRLLQIEGDTTAATTTTATTSKSHKLKRGVDCGAGIGRVTEGLLGKVCETVDVVEPVEKFAQVIRDGPLMKKQKQNKEGVEKDENEDEDGQDGVVEDVYIVGLENWHPEKKYDLIWNQWCVGHLTDAQLVAYLKRAASALTPNGLLVLKENNSTELDGTDAFDAVDNAVTRTDESFRRLFKEAGLVLFKSEEQLGFPRQLNLLPVRYYALRRPSRPT